MDGQHHPDGADVLDERFPYDPHRCCGPVDMPSEVLAALADAGLAVVRVGDVPPWMERVEWEYEDIGPSLLRTPPDHVTDAYVVREAQP